MGMAASQARLLSITARLSDNEQSGQQLSYAKERLADKTDQVTKEYNEALKATKLQIMTGYADGAASYTDISFVNKVGKYILDILRTETNRENIINNVMSHFEGDVDVIRIEVNKFIDKLIELELIDCDSKQ